MPHVAQLDAQRCIYRSRTWRIGFADQQEELDDLIEWQIAQPLRDALAGRPIAFAVHLLFHLKDPQKLSTVASQAINITRPLSFTLGCLTLRFPIAWASALHFVVACCPLCPAPSTESIQPLTKGESGCATLASAASLSSTNTVALNDTFPPAAQRPVLRSTSMLHRLAAGTLTAPADSVPRPLSPDSTARHSQDSAGVGVIARVPQFASLPRSRSRLGRQAVLALPFEAVSELAGAATSAATTVRRVATPHAHAMLAQITAMAPFDLTNGDAAAAAQSRRRERATGDGTAGTDSSSESRGVRSAPGAATTRTVTWAMTETEQAGIGQIAAPPQSNADAAGGKGSFEGLQPPEHFAWAPQQHEVEQSARPSPRDTMWQLCCAIAYAALAVCTHSKRFGFPRMAVATEALDRAASVLCALSVERSVDVPRAVTAALRKQRLISECEDAAEQPSLAAAAYEAWQTLQTTWDEVCEGCLTGLSGFVRDGLAQEARHYTLALATSVCTHAPEPTPLDSSELHDVDGLEHHGLEALQLFVAAFPNTGLQHSAATGQAPRGRARPRSEAYAIGAVRGTHEASGRRCPAPLHCVQTWGDFERRVCLQVDWSRAPSARAAVLRALRCARQPRTPFPSRSATGPGALRRGERPSSKAVETVHLIVFVHGFAGLSTDLRVMCNHMRELTPNARTLSLQSFQSCSAGPLASLAECAAGEILAEVDALRAEGTRIEHISFASHSAGGLVVRALLQRADVRPLLPLLHTFVSVAAPHLGLQPMPLWLSAGCSVLSSHRKLCKGRPGAHLLSELSLRDAARLEDCTLARLAADSQGLAAFRRIFLVCSSQDGYIPVESALCLPPAARGDSRVARLQRLMAWQLEQRCRPAAAGDRLDGGGTDVATLERSQSGKRHSGPWPAQGDAAMGRDEQAGHERLVRDGQCAELVRIRVVFPAEDAPGGRCCAMRQQHKGHIQFLESEEMAHLLLHAAVLPSLQPD